eukprot:6315789-Amphidinium_carterae.1
MTTNYRSAAVSSKTYFARDCRKKQMLVRNQRNVGQIVTYILTLKFEGQLGEIKDDMCCGELEMRRCPVSHFHKTWGLEFPARKHLPDMFCFCVFTDKYSCQSWREGQNKLLEAELEHTVVHIMRQGIDGHDWGPDFMEHLNLASFILDKISTAVGVLQELHTVRRQKRANLMGWLKAVN